MENILIAIIGALGLSGAAVFTGFIQLKIARLTQTTKSNTERFDYVAERLSNEIDHLAWELKKTTFERDVLKTEARLYSKDEDEDT